MPNSKYPVLDVNLQNRFDREQFERLFCRNLGGHWLGFVSSPPKFNHRENWPDPRRPLTRGPGLRD